MKQYSSADNRKIVLQIDELLGSTSVGRPDPGDVWADRALSDLAAMPPEAQSAWAGLFAHAATADGSKPNAKWLAEAARHRQTIRVEDLSRHLAAWLALVAPPPAFDRVVPKYEGANIGNNAQIYVEWQRASAEYSAALKEYQEHISEKNVTMLKGLAWYASGCDTPDMARGLGHMTQAAFTSVVGYEAGAGRAGNAGIWALGQMPDGVGVGPLARLRTRLRDRGALKLIAAAIESAAKTAGMTVDELEDLAVPTGGLEADGTRRESFGAAGSALLSLGAASGQTRLEWFGADGKPRKAVPAGVKREFAAEVKALKLAEEEIKQALSAQAARFDGFLIEERAWPLAVWRERYGSHPVLGNLARRLVWTIENVPCLLVGDTLQDVAGKALEGLGDETPISLWHPIRAVPETVMRWRDTLETRGIVQPFKQAHREVYLLTDAERATRTYSNRFAAHILKQHQFNSLCVLRGWKNTLRLMVDDSYPPATRLLPRYGLRAEFWVEGIGDDYGVDTNDAGTYLRLATDQVRFYREDAPINYAHAGGGGYTPYRPETPADPLPLDQVPPLALSEVMRDVDLFVGVASVGNDPAWADGGPEGRYRDYWQDYAFGDLGETAKTRAAVLARLLPRLKIAPRCRLDGRFLLVRGDLRDLQDPPGQRQHPDGAERPVPLHRAGARRRGDRRPVPSLRGGPAAGDHPQQSVPAGRRQQDQGHDHYQPDQTCSALARRREVKLHAFMRGDEAQPLIEAVGVASALVGRELHQATTLLPGAADGPGEQGTAYSFTATARVNVDGFYLRPPASQSGDAGEESQLQGADDLAAPLGDDQFMVRVRIDLLEGVIIGLRERVLELLPLPSQRVIGQHADNLPHVAAPGAADEQVWTVFRRLHGFLFSLRQWVEYTMNIRLMAAADAPAVALLSEQLGYPIAPGVIADRLAMLPQNAEHGCYIAELGGIVVGWIHVFGVHMLTSPRFFAEIGGLVVDAGTRRQGAGRALMSQAEMWAQAHGYSEVRLRSGLHRTEAHEFYRSIGYDLTKTSHMFRKALPVTLASSVPQQPPLP